MKILINMILRFFSLVLVAEFIFFQQLQAQEDTNYVDLGVEFTNAPASVKINGVFGVTGRVFMDANSSNIPSSEKISVSVLLIDPNGIILDSHSQTWSGFNPTTNGNLSNSKDQMLFQIPWSQSKNWEEDANWTLTAELSTSSIDANPNNNAAKILLNLDVPDLEVSITSVSAVSPLEGGLSNDYVPNTNYVVKGTVTNLGNVMTQPGIYIPVTAKLFQSGGSTVDTETILLPREDQFNTLPPSGSWEFEIENLFLPPDASGSYEVSVTMLIPTVFQTVHLKLKATTITTVPN